MTQATPYEKEICERMRNEPGYLMTWLIESNPELYQLAMQFCCEYDTHPATQRMFDAMEDRKLHPFAKLDITRTYVGLFLPKSHPDYVRLTGTWTTDAVCYSRYLDGIKVREHRQVKYVAKKI